MAVYASKLRVTGLAQEFSETGSDLKLTDLIFNSLIDVWICCKTRSFVFESLHKTRSPSPGACKSHSKPMSRYFYRQVYL